MKTAYLLEVKESVTCAFCLSVATRFIVQSSSHGELLAVCDKHAKYTPSRTTYI